MRPIRISLALSFCVLLFGACKQEESPPPATPVPTAYPMPPAPGPTAGPAPTAPAPAPTAPAPAPTPAPTSPPASGPTPVAGLPCAYDTDLQCPFGRCINGRCGGCQSGADCKSGAACLSTPVGMACMPSGAPPSTPAPTATTPPTPAPTATTPPAPSDPFAAARARCLDRINAYRGSAGVAPLSSNAGKLACVDGQAQKDALAQTAHGAFGQCSEAAQNECPGWSGTPESVVDSCLDMMFKEGPGSGSAHGHYTNMMEPSYRTVACGFYVTSSGAVWITQDFYR